MLVKEVNYKGLNCIELSNDFAILVISISVGPRILVYKQYNGVNFFANFDEQIENIIPDEWQSYGGHRLWHAPEVASRTYYPDNDPVEYKVNGNSVELICKREVTTNLEKNITITLDENSSKVTLSHKIYNRSPWGVKFAPWTLSVMAPEGRLVVPQEPFVPHGSGENESFDAGRPLVLWQFTNMADPRFTWGEKFIQMEQNDAMPTKQKFGVTNTLGYACYALGSELFVKHYDYVPNGEYTDLGCNSEFFTMPRFLEMESLGEYKEIAPDDFAEVNESWQLYNVTLSKDDNCIAEQLSALI